MDGQRPGSADSSISAMVPGRDDDVIGRELDGDLVVARAVEPVPAAGLRLSRALGTSERLWIDIQADYDIEVEHDSHEDELNLIESLISWHHESAYGTDLTKTRPYP